MSSFPCHIECVVLARKDYSVFNRLIMVNTFSYCVYAFYTNKSNHNQYLNAGTAHYM